MTAQVAEITEPLLAEGRSIFRRIFVPIDYTPDSQRALGAALELQRLYGSAIRLFHIQHGDGMDDFLGGLGSLAGYGDWVDEARGRLRRYVENVAPNALPHVELHAGVGGESDRATLLRAEAAEWDTTLMIVTEHQHSTLFRSVAEKVIRGMGCAVLVLPPIAVG